MLSDDTVNKPSKYSGETISSSSIKVIYSPRAISRPIFLALETPDSEVYMTCYFVVQHA